MKASTASSPPSRSRSSHPRCWSRARARSGPALRFGLQLSSFAGDPDGGPLADRVAEAATIAEAVGFTSLWVMDHMVQIPQVGRRWEDLPESWTTLAWLAARTRTIRLGTLVTGVTLRNPAHLAKIVATLDVLSGGRAICGLGLAWWEWEHRLYGWPFPADGRPVRPARGHPAAAAGDVGPGIAALRGPDRQGRRDHLLPPSAAGARAHPGRRVRGKPPRSGWPPATPTPAICSATRRPWPASAPFWSDTAPTPAGDPAEVRVTHLSTAVVAGSPTGGDRGRRTPAAGRPAPGTGCGPVGRRNRRGPDRAVPPAARPRASRRPSSPCPTFSPLAPSKRSDEVIAGFDAPPPSVPW